MKKFGCRTLSLFEKLHTSINSVFVNYTRPSLLLLSVFLMSGCASYYSQSVRDDAAIITVLNPRIITEEKYRPFIALNINEKRVERAKADFEKDPQTSYVQAFVDPGVHEIKIEVTAYHGARAKYNTVKLTLDFEPNTKYQLYAAIPEISGDDMLADSWTELTMLELTSKREVLKKKLILKDNGMRSVVENPEIVVPIIL